MAYLIRRNGRYSYNRAYPKELWRITGSAPFRRALNTDSLEQAQRQRPEAERQYWLAVDQARTKLGEIAPRPLSDLEAQGIVSRWFAKRNSELDHDHLHLPTPPEGWADAVAGNEFTVAHSARLLGQEGVGGLEPLAKRVLEAEGINADPASRGYKALLQYLARANKELAAADLARLRGDFGYSPADPIMRAALEAKPTPKRSIADLIEAYEADKAGGWSISTKNAYGPVWRLLKDTLGASKDISSVTRDDGRMLFATVKALPRNMGKLKALDGLTVPQAVEKAQKLDLPTISPKTINDSYMALLVSAFGWAVKEQWIAANPVSGLSVTDKVDAADKRDPFTVDQLNHLFKLAPWSRRDGDASAKPIRFWGPLLALFHGMRRGEIAQLTIADIETVDGIPVILVRPGEAGQRVKTAAGRRMLPVHSELQRMGFLAFVQAQRTAAETQLFPGEAPNGNGQWGDGLSDWFGRLLDTNKISGRKLGMHSFRHNFEDRLRAAGLRGTDIGKELAGRSKGKSDSGEIYGSGYSASDLAAAMAKISYPDLDLSHLHAKGPE